MADEKTIRQIAHLARLELSDEEIASFPEQMTKILGYFDEICKVATEGVEPLVTPTDMEEYWREDLVSSDLGAKEALMNAPDKRGSLFKVPPVV